MPMGTGLAQNRRRGLGRRGQWPCSYCFHLKACGVGRVFVGVKMPAWTACLGSCHLLHSVLKRRPGVPAVSKISPLCPKTPGATPRSPRPILNRWPPFAAWQKTAILSRRGGASPPCASPFPASNPCWAWPGTIEDLGDEPARATARALGMGNRHRPTAGRLWRLFATAHAWRAFSCCSHAPLTA